jgi:hypothetical protein
LIDAEKIKPYPTLFLFSVGQDFRGLFSDSAGAFGADEVCRHGARNIFMRKDFHNPGLPFPKLKIPKLELRMN